METSRHGLMCTVTKELMCHIRKKEKKKSVKSGTGRLGVIRIHVNM